MRDIIYRPVQAHSSEEIVPASPPPGILPVVTEPSRLNKILHTLNMWAGSFVGMFEGNRQEASRTITPIYKEKVRRFPLPKIATERVRKGSRIVYEKSRDTAATTKRHLKTPVGKVAAVNMIALIALFAYIQAQPHVVTTQAGRDAGTALTNSPLQKYLPVVATTSPSAFNETSVTQTTKHLPLYAWVSPWNLSQIAVNKSSYSSFSAFWVSVGSDGSTLTPKDSFSDWQTFAQENAGTNSTYLTVDGDPNFTYTTITNPAAEQAFIGNVLGLLNQYNFTGLDLDFEGLGSANSTSFTAFTRTVATALHADNKLLSVTLESRIANQVPMDWHSIGQIADEVRIMIYDYHSQTTAQPGPIAPLGWVKEVLDYAVQNIDPSKIVVGLGNYGYDWTAPATGSTSWTGTGISYEQAQALSESQKTPILQATGIDPRGYDIGTAPYFQYTDANGNLHQVWFEDSNSLQQKVELANQYPLKGIIFWSVGLGDQSFWDQQ